MNESARDSTDSFAEVYAVVVARLRSRPADVAEAVHASIRAYMPGLAVNHDAEYQAGRAAAVMAIVEYSLDAIERGGEWGPIPHALAAQVHRAARIGVRPGMLVRRYLAGHRRFMNLIAEEAKESGYTDHEAVLEDLRGTYRSLLEHILTSIEHEYDRESATVARSPEQRRNKLVQRLLVEDVDPVELKELDYEVLTSWHLGLIAPGIEGAEALRRLKIGQEGDLLSVPGQDGTVLAWLRGKTKLTVPEFKHMLSASGYPHAPLAVGEPGRGLEGWRQTHQEARVALLIVRQELQGLTRCADVLPVVGALQNEAIISMYEKTYILPLNTLRRGGQPARRAMLAYFKHGRNASTAGDAIKVTRRTIENHLKEVRKVLDAPLNMTGLEIALRLEELGYMADAKPSQRIR
jgi:hypothetical protein